MPHEHLHDKETVEHLCKATSSAIPWSMEVIMGEAVEGFIDLGVFMIRLHGPWGSCWLELLGSCAQPLEPWESMGATNETLRVLTSGGLRFDMFATSFVAL